MYCKKCNTNLPDGTKFCSNCGSKIESAVYETKTDDFVDQKTRFKKSKFSKVLFVFFYSEHYAS